MATIRYFLPEDGDQEDTPNVFLSPKPSRPGYPPLLGQIKGSFPLPGVYHFRFKTALIPGTDRDKNAVAVWMDCVNESEPVPVWQNSIVAKVTRISVDDDDYDEDFAGSGASVGVSREGSNVSGAPVPSSRPRTGTDHSHTTDSLLDAFDDPPPAAPAASGASSAHSSTGNLLDVDHPDPPAPASGGSLLDMDHLSGSSANNSGHNELLNMSAPMPAHQSQPSHVPGNHTPVQPMQQQMPMQQQPVQGQYPMQYPPQVAQQMAQMPAPQQQQRNQQQSGGKNAFDKFGGSTLDPLGNLSWS